MKPPTDLFKPRRGRLCDALGCLTDRDGEWWGDQMSFERAVVVWNSDAAWVYMPTHDISSTRRKWRTKDPKEAWEIVCARLDMDAWVDDPDRRFVGATVDVMTSHPTTVASCVAIASDADGVLTAEAMARQITGLSRVAWAVMPRTAAMMSFMFMHDLPGGHPINAQCELLSRSREPWYTTEPHLRAIDLLSTGYALWGVGPDVVSLYSPEL